jgi:hypothetical protein
VSNTTGTVEGGLSSFRMHPNPAAEQVQLFSATRMESVRVFNVQGVEVFRSDDAGEQLNITTASWPAGTYLVHVFGNGHKTINKLLVIH